MLRKLFLTLLFLVLATVIGLVAYLYIAPAAFTEGALMMGRRFAGLERKEVTLPDGTHYVYLEGGQGEPLLLLHGFGTNKDNFVAMAPYLRKRYHLIIPDHVGFGESSKPAQGDYSPEAQADRLHVFVQAIGLHAPIHVGGNSMGGMIAMHYGARFPTETATLWLLDPAGVFSAPETELFKQARHSPHNPLLIRNADDLAFLMSKATAKPMYLPRPMLEVFAHEQIANSAVQQRVMAALMKSDSEKTVAGLKVPTLIVWGDQDQLVHPDGAKILHRLLPNSSVIIMSGIGHVPMMEAPRRTAMDFMHFQDSLSPNAPAAPQAGQAY